METLSARAADEQRTWQAAAWILGQSAAIGALLVFFGWARTRETYRYFGVELSLLDLSTTDYVLRSVNTAYEPLLRAGVVAAGALVAHALLTRRSDTHGWNGLVIAGAGTLLAALGSLSLLFKPISEHLGAWIPEDPGVLFAWLPTSLAISFALLAATAETVLRLGPPFRVLFIALSASAMIWMIALFAVRDGAAAGRRLHEGLARTAEVRVYSERSIFLHGPGVHDHDIAQPSDRRRAPIRYRKVYTGLRLLLQSHGRYFLLPHGWTKGRDAVFEVPDDGHIRIDIVA